MPPLQYRGAISHDAHHDEPGTANCSVQTGLGMSHIRLPAGTDSIQKHVARADIVPRRRNHWVLLNTPKAMQGGTPRKPSTWHSTCDPMRLSAHYQDACRPVSS